MQLVDNFGFYGASKQSILGSQRVPGMLCAPENDGRLAVGPIIFGGFGSTF